MGATTTTTTLNFFDGRSPGNDYRWTESNQSERPSNLSPPDPHDVIVHDLRPISVPQREEMGFTLETAGFEIVQGWGTSGEEIAAGWAEGMWADGSWITREYYPHVKRMLTEKFGADEVAIFDHTIRKRNNTDISKDHSDVQVPPAEQAHIDQTYWAAIERVRMHLGDGAAQSVLDGKSIARICNVWRPLVGPVYDRPLAMADHRSLDERRDFQETLPAPPGCRTGESQMVRYHPEQRWYYLSKMMPDECLLLKCFDSKTGVRSPHSAFVDPSTPVDAEPRWSIEVRTVSLMNID